MKSDDPGSSNNNKPKAYIKEKYKNNKLPSSSYMGVTGVTVNEIKERYGNRYYRKLDVAVNDILNRGKKLPLVSNKIY